LSAAGLPTDAFFFGGFLPARSGERKRRLKEVAEVPGTLVFYEAPHRLSSTLSDCLTILGDRNAVVARELTKLHDEMVRGRVSDLISHFGSTPPKGEIVLVIERGSDEQATKTISPTVADRVAELEAEGRDHRSALKQAAREFGLSRSQAYRELQQAKNS